MGLNAQKRFRQGQILKLIASEPISSQDELRRRLSHVKVRVTQATLSRDMSELKLVKTSEGYKPLTNGEEASTPLPPLGRALREFLVDLRPAFNLLVLEDAAFGRATARCGARCRKIQGSGRDDCRRRHSSRDHALAPGSSRRPETNGGLLR